MLSITVDTSTVKLGFYAATNKPEESTTVAVSAKTDRIMQWIPCRDSPIVCH